MDDQGCYAPFSQALAMRGLGRPIDGIQNPDRNAEIRRLTRGQLLFQTRRVLLRMNG